MYPFKKLSIQENEALLKFPAYISLLAANNNYKLDKQKKSQQLNSHILKLFPAILFFLISIGRLIRSLKII